ncbi:hypothetical protein B0T14DRAFT_559388 [Immersiella caudata]|uniref:Rhodopsin domain-containing protein n=1 Tax=Immersiella caudata TaxID=314043 RepID=A0AA39XDF7_9PEZI|nr:hypothetical protein B0T14DRAFT_559388 [Immersiella caudata]
MANDEDRVAMLLATSIVVYIFAHIACICRVIIHLRYKFLNQAIAACIITVATLACTPVLVLTIIAIRHGFGKHTTAVSSSPADINVIFKCLLGVSTTGVLIAGLARISIASLQLQTIAVPHPLQRCSLWAVIVLQTLFLIVYEGMQLAHCWPVLGSQSKVCETLWFDRTKIPALSIASIIGNTLSDFICILSTVFTLSRVTVRPAIDKRLMRWLSFACLLATLCGFLKAYFLARYDWGTNDAIWEVIPLFICSRAEEGLIIIGACAPLWKTPARSMFDWFNGLRLEGSSDRLNMEAGSVDMGASKQGRVSFEIVPRTAPHLQYPDKAMLPTP